MNGYADQLRRLADLLDKDFGGNVSTVYKSVKRLTATLQPYAFDAFVALFRNHFKSHDSEKSVKDELRIWFHDE